MDREIGRQTDTQTHEKTDREMDGWIYSIDDR
jgi:hypothetical protein